VWAFMETLQDDHEIAFLIVLNAFRWIREICYIILLPTISLIEY
jgi:hypothetical protein